MKKYRLMPQKGSYKLFTVVNILFIITRMKIERNKTKQNIAHYVLEVHHTAISQPCEDNIVLDPPPVPVQT